MDWTTFAPFDALTVHARSHHAELLAAAERDRRRSLLAGNARPAHRLGARFATTMGRAATAARGWWPDSRDGLRSPEQELARRGVSWASDPAHDRELALELAAARLRRAGRTAAPSTVATLPAVRPLAGARHAAVAA